MYIYRGGHRNDVETGGCQICCIGRVGNIGACESFAIQLAARVNLLTEQVNTLGANIKAYHFEFAGKLQSHWQAHIAQSCDRNESSFGI